MQFLKQSTAVTVKVGPFVDESDGFTRETTMTSALGVDFDDFRLSKDGGDFAAKSETTKPTHDEGGVFDCMLDATDTGTLGRLDLHVNCAGVARPVMHHYMVLAEAAYDALVTGTAVTADVLNADRTWEAGREGNTSEQIVKLNTWSGGTRKVSADFTKALNPGTTIASITSAAVTKKSDSSTVTTSNTAVRQDKVAVNFDIAAISSAAAYRVEVIVVGTDGVTYSLEGDLIVE